VEHLLKGMVAGVVSLGVLVTALPGCSYDRIKRKPQSHPLLLRWRRPAKAT
jgi:hypothetical protein